MKWFLIFVLLLLAAAGWGLKELSPIMFPDQEALAQIDRRSVSDSGQPPFAVSYLAAGDPASPRLIYVHGTPGSAANWSDYLTDPVPGWESIAYDRPGFGETRPLFPATSLQRQAQALEPFLIERRGRRPLLVGHSLGGAVICRAAADFPDRVGGLLVVAGSVDPNLEKFHWFQRLFAHPKLTGFLPSALSHASLELQVLKKELQDLERDLGRITVPVVILHGLKDSLVSSANVPYLAAGLTASPKVETILPPGDGHLIIWKNKPAVDSALLRLMELALSSSVTRPKPGEPDPR